MAGYFRDCYPPLGIYLTSCTTPLSPFPGQSLPHHDASSLSQICAYTQSMPHSCCPSMRRVLIMTATLTFDAASSCPSCTLCLWVVYPKRITTLPKASYNEETTYTTCTMEISRFIRLPISYSFGVFDRYDATHTSSRFMSRVDVGCFLF